MTAESYWQATCLSTDPTVTLRLDLVFMPNLGEDPFNPSGPCSIEYLFIDYTLVSGDPREFEDNTYFFNALTSFTCTWDGVLEGIFGSVDFIEAPTDSGEEEDAPEPAQE